MAVLGSVWLPVCGSDGVGVTVAELWRLGQLGWAGETWWQ